MFSKLNDIYNIGIHIYAPDNPDTTIIEISNSIPSAFYIGVVEGKKDINSLFQSFSDALAFPDYFGNNWAAFEECLNDLDWLDAEGYVVIIKNAEVLATLSEFELLIRILCNTVSEWRIGRNNDDFPTQPTPFHILFLVSKENENCFMKAIQDSGCNKVDIITCQ